MAKPDLKKLHAEATEWHKRGEFEKAEKLYRDILRHRPDLADIHNSRGAALAGMRRFKESLEAFRRAVALNPDNANFRSNLGNALKDSGLIAEAKQQYQIILRDDPNFINAHIQLGLIYRNEMNWPLAIDHFYRVCELKPDLLDGFVQLGLALMEWRGYDRAIKIFQRAVELSPTCEIALLGLGDSLLALNRASEAVAWFKKVAVFSAEPVVALKLGRALQEAGQNEEAVSLYYDMIDKTPEQLQGYLGLATAKKFSEQDSALVEQVEQLAQRQTSSQKDTVLAYFALGKMCDDMGRVDKAFHFYALGNQLNEGKYKAYTAAENREEITSLISEFDTDFFIKHTGVGHESEQPVFVVGMPRSGTTLVEQILASHPNIAGAGEVLFWANAQIALPVELNTDLPYPKCAQLLDKQSAARIGNTYLERLVQLSGEPDAERIVDKMPNNFLLLGLIATIFPKARIIHIQRDAMDNCLSIYFQNFETEHWYASDLAKTGHHYREYERTIQHWREVLPIKMLEISYEDLVINQERVTREMINYVGLPWDDRCLQPEKAEKVVRTASLWQARQPVYKTSVARWKKYEKYLGPLKEALHYSEGSARKK